MRRTPGKHIKISYCDRLHSEGSLLKFEVKAGKFGVSPWWLMATNARLRLEKKMLSLDPTYRRHLFMWETTKPCQICKTGMKQVDVYLPSTHFPGSSYLFVPRSLNLDRCICLYLFYGCEILNLPFGFPVIPAFPILQFTTYTLLNFTLKLVLSQSY